MSSDKYYDMEEQSKIEEAMTPIVMDFLKKKFGKEPTDIRHLHTETDFKCAGLKFDLKADTRIAETNNLFIETISVMQNTEIRKKGWLYNQECDYIIYLDTQNLRLLLLPLKSLQKYERYIKNFPERKISQTKDYVTQGHLVPVSVIFYWLGIGWIELKIRAKGGEKV